MLAKVGFFYKGPGDLVKCFFCNVQIELWKAGDDELGEHIRLSPNCPFVKRRAASNVPYGPIDTLKKMLPPTIYKNRRIYEISIDVSLQPDNVYYKSVIERLLTFDNWQKKHPSPKDLSEAGFFFDKNDTVVCFCCSGIVYDWNETDDPWELHAFYYNLCKYVKIKKGQTYINNIKKKYPNGIKKSLEIIHGKYAPFFFLLLIEYFNSFNKHIYP